MGKVIQLSSHTKERKQKLTSQYTAMMRVSEQPNYDGCLRGPSQVIPVDFSETQLQLLRIKGKKLEEAKLVLYKGDVNIDLPVTPHVFAVNVRVLVKKQRLEYYFYCPRCGAKVDGTLEIGSSCGSDHPGISWDEIQQTVRTHILKRTEEGDYPKCTERSASDKS